MSDKEARKARLKELARAGLFDEIEAEFGAKGLAGAHAWLAKRQQPTETAEASATNASPADGADGNAGCAAADDGAHPPAAAPAELALNAEPPADDGADGAEANALPAAVMPARLGSFKKAKPASAVVTTVDDAADAAGESASPEPSRAHGVVADDSSEALPSAADAGGVDAATSTSAPAAIVKKAKKAKTSIGLTPTRGDAAAGAAAAGDDAAAAAGDDGGDSAAKPAIKKKKSPRAASGDAATSTESKPKVARPPTAYNLFNKAYMKELKAAEPGIALSELGQRSGAAWKALGEEEKAVWNQRAAEAKEAAAAASVDGVAPAAPSKPKNARQIASVDAGASADGDADGDSAPKPKKPKALKLAAATGAGGDAGSAMKLSKKQKKTSASVADNATAAAAGDKATGGHKRKRKGGDSEDERSDGDCDDNVDPDEVIITKDPRHDAIKRNATSAAKVSGGAIVGADWSADADMPHATGRFDYSRYQFEVGATIALVLPAWNEFAETHAEELSKAVESDGVVIDDLTHLHAMSKTGVVYATVLAKDALEPGAAAAAAAKRIATGMSGKAVIHSDDLEDIDLSSGSDDDDSSSEDDGEKGDEEDVDMRRKRATSRAASSAPRESKRGRRKVAPWYQLTLQVRKRLTSSEGVNQAPDDDDASAAIASADDAADVALAPLPGADGPIIVKLPWLPPQDPRMDALYVLNAEAFDASAAREVQAGTQIRMMFPEEADPSHGFWLEGRVYASDVRQVDKQAGWTRSPYKALKVIWYEQDAKTLAWYMPVLQTDNDVSHWELSTERLPFVHRDDTRAFVTGTPVLTRPVDVINYLMETEAAAFFKEPVPKTETNYYARIRNPIDFSMMKKRALVGIYDEPASTAADGDGTGAGGVVSSSQPLDDSQAWAPEEDDSVKAASSSTSSKPAAAAASDNSAPRGIQGLWEDIRLLVKNAKVANQKERIEWRCADAVELLTRRIKKAYVHAPAAGAGADDDSGGASPSALSSYIPISSIQLKVREIEAARKAAAGGGSKTSSSKTAFGGKAAPRASGSKAPLAVKVKAATDDTGSSTVSVSGKKRKASIAIAMPAAVDTTGTEEDTSNSVAAVELDASAAAADASTDTIVMTAPPPAAVPLAPLLTMKRKKTSAVAAAVAAAETLLLEHEASAAAELEAPNAEASSASAADASQWETVAEIDEAIGEASEAGGDSGVVLAGSVRSALATGVPKPPAAKRRRVEFSLPVEDEEAVAAE